MTTVANVRTAESAHWYTVKGEPCYELPKKDGSGMKSPTLADARKLNLLPGVSSILRLLDKPELTTWKIEQGVLAVQTTPALPDECGPKCDKCGHAPIVKLDAFLNRVLQVERVQDQEAATARDRGTEIHKALEDCFQGVDVTPDLLPWIRPAAEAIFKRGTRVTSEKVVVGYGYAGRVDLIQESEKAWLIWDFKTTKKLPPKESWSDHVLQLAAYAKAFERMMAQSNEPPKPIQTLNCYISSLEQGKFVIWENNPVWTKDFAEGFAPLVTHWQYKNDYKPQQ